MSAAHTVDERRRVSRQFGHRVWEKTARIPGPVAALGAAAVVVALVGGVEFWLFALVSAGVAAYAGTFAFYLSAIAGAVLAIPLVVVDHWWPGHRLESVAMFLMRAVGVGGAVAFGGNTFLTLFPVEDFDHLWFARTGIHALATTVVGTGLVAGVGCLAGEHHSRWKRRRLEADETLPPVTAQASSSAAGPSPRLNPPAYSMAMSTASRAAWARWVLAGIDDEPDQPDDEYWSPAPIEGWRAWTWDGTSLRGMRVPWPTPRLQAECRFGVHDAPDWDCTCGIYAVKDPRLIPRFGFRRGAVIGRVELSGLVIEHEEGYRAEVAVITHLWVFDPALKGPVQAAYPTVEVAVVGPPFGSWGGRR